MSLVSYRNQIFLTVLLLANSLTGFAQVKLTTGFENGSGQLVEYLASARTLVFKAEQKNIKGPAPDTRAVWFYFKLTGLSAQDSITLRYTYERKTYAPQRLVVSTNRRDWQVVAPSWGVGYADYKLLPASDSLFVASGYPYTYTDWQDKLIQLTTSGFCVKGSISKSISGYDVPLLKSREIATGQSKNLFVFMGRQHAFESPSSYALDGFLTFLNSNDSLAIVFRAKAAFICLPIMDVDKVIIGGTGKDQLPQDMNRSWTPNSPWPQVKSVQSLIKSLDKKSQIRGFIDFHSPYPQDAKSTHYYNTDTIGSPRHLLIEEIFDRYKDLEGLKAKLKVSKSNYPPPAEGEKVVRTFMRPDHKSGFLKSLLFATTFEQAWDYRPDGKPYDQQALRMSGANLAKAMILSVMPKLK